MCDMLLSLMICTHQRDRELKDVIRTLSPLPKEIEIVLVDQNSEGERVEIGELEEAGLDSSQITVVHRKLGSLSSARNEGFKWCRGTFIGIPDDDNYYDSSFGESIVRTLDSVKLDNECGGVILNWGAFQGFPMTERKMKSVECLRYGNSGTLILKREVICEKLGMSPFPEDMSPGTRFPAGDETYFLACFLKRSGLSMIAAPKIYIDHPIFPETSERENVYSYGFGALAYKLFVMGWGPGIFYAVRLLVGPLVKLISFKTEEEARRRAWLMLRRRWQGAIDFASSEYKNR